MELAPDLQFKHMTVRDAQLPFEVVSQLPADALARRHRDLLRRRAPRRATRAHSHPAVVVALEGTHWFEVREWATSGPGSSAGASAA